MSVAIKTVLYSGPAAKGTTIAVTLYFLNVDFLKSLAIAATSAIISGAFLLATTAITIRETRENRRMIGNVQDSINDSNGSNGSNT